MVWRTRGSVDNGKRLRRIGTLACNPWTKLPHWEKGRGGGSMQNKALVSLCETNTWCFLWNVSLTNRTSFSRDYGSDKAINGWKEFRFTANVNLSFPGAAQTQPRLWQIWVSWGAGQCERPLNTLAPEILTRSSISHVQICMGTELIKHGSILPSICHLPVETNDVSSSAGTCNQERYQQEPKLLRQVFCLEQALVNLCLSAGTCLSPFPSPLTDLLSFPFVHLSQPVVLPERNLPSPLPCHQTVQQSLCCTAVALRR